MKYYINIEDTTYEFKSKSQKTIPAIIKNKISKHGLELTRYLLDLGCNIKKCRICNTHYNTRYTIKYTISADNEVSISDIEYDANHYNKHYCYGNNTNCKGLGMNPNSIEFISKTMNLNEYDAKKFIHENNKSPFYSKNHNSYEDYINSQKRDFEYYVNKYGVDIGTSKYNNFVKNVKYKNSLNYYQDTYGKIKGKKIFESISSKKAITFENLMLKYNDEELVNKKLESWKSTCSKSLYKLVNEIGYNNAIKKMQIREQKRKQTLIENGKIFIPNELKFEYSIYRSIVEEETREQLLQFGTETFGDNWYKNKKENKLTIDHKYSIKSGFLNQVPANIIGNICNLELLSKSKNSSKKDNNSQTLEQLLNKITEQNHDK